MTKKTGRPTVFTPEVLEQILEEIRHGASERSIFDREEMPSWSAWGQFKARADDAFMSQYERAKELKYQSWESEIVKIAKDDSRDMQPDGKGGFKSDNTAVNRDRLKVDTMKWLMSKMMPKVYGDKIAQEITGADGAPLIPELNINIKK